MISDLPRDHAVSFDARVFIKHRSKRISNLSGVVRTENSFQQPESKPFFSNFSGTEYAPVRQEKSLQASQVPKQMIKQHH